MKMFNVKYLYPFNSLHSTSTIPSGFTLMEVLISLAILSIALVAVLKANISIEDTNQAAEEEIMANLLAQNIMAHIQNFGIKKYDQFPMEIEKKGLEYDIQVDATDIENLWRLKVTIYKLDATVNQLEAFFWSDD
jgi:type II secretion system protein I